MEIEGDTKMEKFRENLQIYWSENLKLGELFFGDLCLSQDKKNKTYAIRNIDELTNKWKLELI